MRRSCFVDMTRIIFMFEWKEVAILSSAPSFGDNNFHAFTHLKNKLKTGKMHSHLLNIRTSDTVHAFDADKNYTSSLLTAMAWMLMKGKRNSLATITAVLFY